MMFKDRPSKVCAACKYQRRKCTADCPLAPYFPADQPKLYKNAQQLFGVKNILKIIRHLDQDRQSEAMRSIIYESNIREMFPVNGCLEVMRFLRWHLGAVEEELRLVSSRLELYRKHPVEDSGSKSKLKLVMGSSSNSSLDSFCANQNEAIYNPIFFDSKDNLGNHLWVQNHFGDNTGIDLQNLVFPCLEQAQSCDNMQPFLDTKKP